MLPLQNVWDNKVIHHESHVLKRILSFYTGGQMRKEAWVHSFNIINLLGCFISGWLCNRVENIGTDKGKADMSFSVHLSIRSTPRKQKIFQVTVEYMGFFFFSESFSKLESNFKEMQISHCAVSSPLRSASWQCSFQWRYLSWPELVYGETIVRRAAAFLERDVSSETLFLLPPQVWEASHLDFIPYVIPYANLTWSYISNKLLSHEHYSKRRCRTERQWQQSSWCPSGVGPTGCPCSLCKGCIDLRGINQSFRYDPWCNICFYHNSL